MKLVIRDYHSLTGRLFGTSGCSFPEGEGDLVEDFKQIIGPFYLATRSNTCHTTGASIGRATCPFMLNEKKKPTES